MDPLVDEKFILTTSAAFMELAYDWLGVSIQREAYGPTMNEGLCYEYCSTCTFDGEIKARLFMGMDGYTKLLLLPYIARKFALDEMHSEVAESSLLSFTNQLCAMINTELNEFLDTMNVSSPEQVSHKLIELPAADYRKYTMIYFLKDDSRPAYLGRVYLFLAVEK